MEKRTTNKKTIYEKYPNLCEHNNLIVMLNEKEIPSNEDVNSPNLENTCYYCLMCGKKLTIEEFSPWVERINLYGHEDALEVGHSHPRAIIDYLGHMANEIYNVKRSYSDEQMVAALTEKLDNVPEKYIKRN